MTRQSFTPAAWAVILRLSRFQLTLSLWLMAAILESLIDAAGGASLETALRVTATYSLGLLLALCADCFLMSRNTTVADFSFYKIVGAAIPSGVLMYIVDVIGRALEHGYSLYTNLPIDIILRTRVNCGYFIVLFAFQFTLSWLSASAKALAARERQLIEAELTALRLQLNPHFLYNTLNSIATLVSEAGNSDAEFMLSRLSEFLEATLATKPTMLVPLAAEMDLVQAYLDIEAVRFGDRLRVEYDCEPKLSEMEVPHFILQPLVENVIKHAVAVSCELVTVSVEASAEEADLILRVHDDGPPRPAASNGCTGVGLRNVAARLEAIYGSRGSIETSSAGAGGFVATIRIPLGEACRRTGGDQLQPRPLRAAAGGRS